MGSGGFSRSLVMPLGSPRVLEKRDLMIQALTHARSLTHVCHIPLCVSEQSDHTSHFILTGHYSARVFTSMSTSHPPIAPPIEPLAALKIHPPPITYSETMPPPSTAPRKRKLVPSTAAASSPSTASGDAEDEDPEYAPEPSTSKRAAKSKAKAGPGRALSREALRKANHSMIERRRREKINAALGGAQADGTWFRRFWRQGRRVQARGERGD